MVSTREGGFSVPYVVEVCCYTIEDVLAAYRGGASRVEICADPAAGGATPSIGLVEYIVENVPVDTAVMIRPRGGDFVYSQEEIAIMQRDIVRAAQAGAKTVVFGVLTEEGLLDKSAMNKLVDTAKEHSLEVTCHRAFDVAREPMQFLDDLIELGVDRLLSSGQKRTVVEGLELLTQLKERAEDRIIIMPCGKLNSSNVREVLKKGFTEVHTRPVETVTSAMKRSAELTMGSDDYDETSRVRISETGVAQVVQIVKG